MQSYKQNNTIADVKDERHYSDMEDYEHLSSDTDLSDDQRETVPGYRQISENARHIKKFKTYEHITKFVLEDAIDLPTDRFERVFDELIDQAYENAKQHYDSQGYEPYKFQIHLFSEILEAPISISLRERDRENDVDEIWNEIEKLDVSI